MTDTLAAALYSIPPEDRETWWKMGAALKSELGDAGFDLWDGWSRQSERYRARAARATWRSLKTGLITIGSLYHEAQMAGWTGTEPKRPRMTPEEKRRRAQRAMRERERARRRQQQAMVMAHEMVRSATLDTHPYLAAKGFPEAQALVLAGACLVPMRDARTGALYSLQEIHPDGTKRFLPGGRAKGTVHRLGRHVTRWYCEGLATGLSVRAALQRLYRRDEVIVCFSAHNVAEVARGNGRASYVVADHDLWTCTNPDCRAKWDGTWPQTLCLVCGSARVVEPAGERYARATGLPYWMPPGAGTDANDFHQAHGVDALADELREVLRDTG